MSLSLLVPCTSHGCCVKVTGIAPCIPLYHHPFHKCEIMQPLMYSTVSEMPSSPCPPIGPVPASTHPKKVGASSTGKEPPSMCWLALVLCVCVCVWCDSVGDSVFICVPIIQCGPIYCHSSYLTFDNKD